MQRLKKDMKERTFAPCYLLYGEEGYLKKNFKNQMKAAIAGEDTMNYSYFDGKGIAVTEVKDIADTLPFFADERLIIIEESGFFKSGGEALAEYIPAMPPTTHIIFVESQVDKRSRLFKKVKELGYVTELGRQTENQLAKWAAGILAKEGRKITENTMHYFLGKVGDDMSNISGELEKLICYTIGRDVITREDVDAICVEQITNKIFEMIGCLAVKNKKGALNLYQDLLTLKEPPMRILFLVARQFNQLLQAKELGGRGDLAGKLKVQPFIARKLENQARAFSIEQLKGYVTACVDAEEAVKSGRMFDQLALEVLISM